MYCIFNKNIVVIYVLVFPLYCRPQKLMCLNYICLFHYMVEDCL